MKIPSFESIISGVRFISSRFPVMIISTLIGTFAFIAAIEEPYNVDEDFFIKIGLFALLAFPVMISSILFSESLSFSNQKKWGIQVLFSVLIVLYYFLTPSLSDFSTQTAIVLFILNLIAWLSITFSGFLLKSSSLEFWQFNRKVVSRFFMSFFFTLTLYSGLALALLAVNYLFNVEIKYQRYTELFCLLTGIFATWHFAAGIPLIVRHINEEDIYPKGLKIFTHFILLPLVILYVIILYAYAIRILVLWELPHGWVSYLVLILSGVGTLSFLFIWPLRNMEKNIWIQSFFRYFYVVLSPLVILLFVAIFRRINDYGITPNRYYVLVAAIWVAFTCIYFIISKKNEIRLVPVSLVVVMMLICFGPWSAYPLSEKSQIKRLEHILTENNVLTVDNPYVIDTIQGAQLNDSICVEINQILSFLGNTDNGLKLLENRWGVKLDKQGDYLRGRNWSVVSKRLGLSHSDTYYHGYYNRRSKFLSWNADIKSPIDIQGYSYMINPIYMYNEPYLFDLGSDTYKISLLRDPERIVLTENGQIVAEKLWSEYIQEIQAKGLSFSSESVDDESLAFTLNSQKRHFRFIVIYFHGEMKEDVFSLYNLRFILLAKNNK